MLYAPEIIVFTGSFADGGGSLPGSTRSAGSSSLLVRRREGIDMMPKLAVSKLDNQAGLIGGAYVALKSGKFPQTL